mmetsp:Transcript_86097/g.152080  ORF Transcript_86097/g.152080 Transcript_86097/m.152080 type:complete len:268 (+) Transcript_86097:203-1006(+)
MLASACSLRGASIWRHACCSGKSITHVDGVIGMVPLPIKAKQVVYFKWLHLQPRFPRDDYINVKISPPDPGDFERSTADFWILANTHRALVMGRPHCVTGRKLEKHLLHEKVGAIVLPSPVRLQLYECTPLVLVQVLTIPRHLGVCYQLMAIANADGEHLHGSFRSLCNPLRVSFRVSAKKLLLKPFVHRSCRCIEAFRMLRTAERTTGVSGALQARAAEGVRAWELQRLAEDIEADSAFESLAYLLCCLRRVARSSQVINLYRTES